MKANNFLLATAIILIGSVPFISCKNKAETPDSPLIGQWQGLSWQNRPVTVTIDQVGDQLSVISFDFSVKKDYPSGWDSVHLYRYSSDGIAPVNADTFLVPIANVNADIEHIEGKFDITKLTLTGTIKIIMKKESDTVIGSYNATKH